MTPRPILRLSSPWDVKHSTGSVEEGRNMCLRLYTAGGNIINQSNNSLTKKILWNFYERRFLLSLLVRDLSRLRGKLPYLPAGSCCKYNIDEHVDARLVIDQ